MQITIPKTSQEERDDFFRKNKWLIHRLWGIAVCFPDLDLDDDGDDDHQDDGGLLQRHQSKEEDNYGDRVDEALSNNKKKKKKKKNKKKEEELEQQLEELEDQIEDTLEDLEDELEELNKGDLSEEERELNEELGEVIDDIQEALDDNDEEETSAKSDSQKPDDLTQIKGLGPKTADKLIDAGINSFKQIASLTAKEVEKLDGKIRNFAKSFKSKKFKDQAEDLL